MNFSRKNHQQPINTLNTVIKTVSFVFIFLFSLFNASAQNENKAQNITVTVKNIKNTNGKVILTLHSAETFMKTKEGLQSSSSNIQGETVTYTFKDVMPGEYAIMGVHDENDNQQMDFELNGMPKESYGMSNNPVLYGPPTFEFAKFEINGEDPNIIIRF